MTLDEATEILRQRPEFDWLVNSGKQWYSIEEVKGDKTGLGDAALRAICSRGEIDGADNYGPGIGWRMPRSGLIFYFARRQAKGLTNEGKGQ